MMLLLEWVAIKEARSGLELLVVGKLPVGDVDAAGEPDTALVEGVFEEGAQTGDAGGLADEAGVEADRHHPGALLPFRPVGVEGAL